VLGVVFLALFVSRRLFTTAREAAEFIDNPRSAAAHGSMSEVKEQFGRLIRHATHTGRLVIIIDDLERCASERALEVCQVASQLLGQPGVVTIVLADMAPIARFAGSRYATAHEDADPEEVGRRYLAKIVQLEIALPPPSPDDMRQVIREYGPSLRHPHHEAAPEPYRHLRAFMRRVRASERRVTGTWQAIERVVERAGWWPLGVLFLVAVIDGIANPRGVDPSAGSDPVATIGGALFVAAFGLGVWSWWTRARTRKRRDELKAEIEKLKQKEDSPDDVARKVLNSKAAGPGDYALVDDLVSSSFLDSEEFRDVEEFSGKNPPALPREAKRSFNHAQLLTEIARARQMFGGTPELTPEHLAKWLVVREQWPALSREIALSPERLTALESRNADGDVPPEVYELLEREPRLSEVIERLVYFKPAGERRDPD
jgi:hypothetical protein